MIKTLFQGICVFFLLFCISCSSAQVENQARETEQTKPNPVDSILTKLNQSTQDLKTYQCQIEYKYEQPSVFGAQTLRKGMLYYLKSNESEKNISMLRVNFQTLQQDEDEEQKYQEQYIVVDGKTLPDTGGKYKGLWLIKLDFELKDCKYIQLTDAGEPNKPVDVFELISTKLPIVGFSKTDRLKKEFDINTVESNTNGTGGSSVELQLKVKPNSVYVDDYVQIDCLIDNKLNLPVKIKAISTEPEGETLDSKDLYEITFVKAKINEKIDKKVFDFQIPKNFGEPVIYPLE